ncbi:PTS sugar transporter subunit IIA [Thermoflavimicrobium daqui]|uniref:PTS EIIA type-2 domain-containing protein n=1 Tax=Thermoflavimicrobium daqui TaxID=2137476 RepID=A0A364K1C2_9BACL|nr:PTS sugar transporter subunit IIA [Thermoflavimicrobium daqui]RAL21383.1 hypothetical protein DL897_16725 [Thermoflavimicrobium daqui]
MFETALIKVNLEARNAYEAIEVLSHVLYEKGYVKDSFINAVINREKVYPTGLPSSGVGVAIPHTDRIHVKQSGIAVATLKESVSFFTMGTPNIQQEVRIIFLLAIDNPDKQIAILKKLISLIKKEDLLKEMIESKSETEIYQLLNSST